MKVLGVGLLAFTGIMTESFVTSGFWSCVVYAVLVFVALICFCWPHGKHEKKRRFFRWHG